MLSAASLVGRLRHPEYTGENRCWPCTAANVLIALSGSTLLATWLALLGSPVVGGVSAALAFALGVGSIALRGYLVPGTPTLTERYVPEPFLRAFGKGSDGPRTVAVGGDTVDVEEILVDLGALRRTGESDLRLADSFRAQWRERIDAIDAETAYPGVLLAGRDARGRLATSDGPESFTARVDGDRVGRWASRAAFRADVAAAALLADRFPEWQSLSTGERGAVVAGLRLFLDTCPACGGGLRTATEPIDSCCGTRTVARVACEDCGVRVFESLARGSSAV